MCASPSTPTPASSWMYSCAGFFRVWDALLCTASTVPVISCPSSLAPGHHAYVRRLRVFMSEESYDRQRQNASRHPIKGDHLKWHRHEGPVMRYNSLKYLHIRDEPRRTGANAVDARWEKRRRACRASGPPRWPSGGLRPADHLAQPCTQARVGTRWCMG